MKRRMLTTAATLLLLSALVQAADDGTNGRDVVATARELYAAAAYEDALAVLNKLRVTDSKSEDARTIEQYRAFCLLALGRRDDAEVAIAAVVTRAPSYHPSDADASPRLRTAFSEVRRRMLPSIVEERYASAKAAYDRKDFVTASEQFKQVTELLADPDLGAAVNQSPLADIRTLALGFRDLSVAAVAPPPPPPAPAPEPVAPPPPPVGPVRGHIYGAEDSSVSPPVAIRQQIPSFEFRAATPNTGMLEIVVGETGAVEAALMRVSVYPKFDAILVEAARSWRFKPATFQGVPVLYRKLVAINVKLTP
jgi:hypothetical protein